MIRIKHLDAENTTIYTVDQVENWNQFTEWLYNLEDIQMSLVIMGNMYRFRTMEERRYFVLGFSKAWDVIDETYIKSYKDE